MKKINKAKVDKVVAKKKKRVTLYVDIELYDEFKGQCGPMCCSKVVSELIRQYVG